MSEPIIVAFVAVGGVIAGAIITGVLNYYSAQQTKKMESYKSQLRQSYRDIAAFHRLEDRYTTALAKNGRTKDAGKGKFESNKRMMDCRAQATMRQLEEAEEKLEQLG